MKEKIFRVADKISEYCIYGMVFFIPISNAAIEILAGFIIASFLVKKIIKPDFNFFKGKEFIFFFAFIFFCALSLVNSGTLIGKSLKGLFFKWLEYLLIFLSVQDALRSRKRIRNFLAIFMSTAAIVGIDALTQKFIGVEFLRHRNEGIKSYKDLVSVTASFGHYNDFGTYLICALSLTISQVLSNVNRKIKLILCCLIILLGACLLFTFSRGAWLGFVCSFIIIMILSRKYLILIHSVFLFLASLVIIAPAREKLFFSFQKHGDANRFIMWRAGWRMIWENPFLGKGLNTYMDYFGQYEVVAAAYAHNCYLQIWAESGIFSLISFLLFLAIILKNAISTFKRTNDFLLLGLIGAIFGFLVSSFFDTPLYSLQLSCLFWCLLGVMESLNNPI